MLDMNGSWKSWKTGWPGRESAKERITTLTGEEFLRRFLQHVLPRGFTRVRHYGWLSPAARERYARVRQILRAGDVVLSRPDKAAILCPCCGHVMTFLHALRTRARPPPRPPAGPCTIAIPA